MKRVAECHCRRLKAFVSGEPIRNYLCHCRACQRRTGSVAHLGTRWEKTRVCLEGSVRIFARQADSGFELRCHFCANCVTSVMMEDDRLPEFCVIAPGCFADLEFPAPTGSIWEESMHFWLVAPSVSEHYSRDCPDVPPI